MHNIEYTKGVEKNLRQVELDAIQDYIKESDNLVSLHDQIRDCDGILSQMETLLSGYKAEIGSISSDIKILHEKSMDMGLKLKNHKVTESKLSNFVADRLELEKSNILLMGPISSSNMVLSLLIFAWVSVLQSLINNSDHCDSSLRHISHLHLPSLSYFHDYSKENLGVECAHTTLSIYGMEFLENLAGQFTETVDEKLNKLKRKLKHLVSKEHDVKVKLEYAEQLSMKKPGKEVQNWLQEVERTKTEVQNLEARVEEMGVFDHLTLRNSIDRYTTEVNQLIQRGVFHGGLTLQV
ncbi:hypothetical protein FNV43_RR07606 [Rhamnella rubrinervis]|uniref:Vps52 coiled-coil domain-containing protein n=1 Tax=Rhamnella rubrinervis TaxID=2594499 RepID=A0A8K0HFL1_9ROSA|nr:hypothetical protein FNV43_RR07606 [Rhamnella rubrinervis]